MLAITGLILSTLFSNAVERNFDLRLQAYLKSLIASAELDTGGKLAQPPSFGETRFDLPFSGWYWQISLAEKQDGDLRTSPSLFEARLALPTGTDVAADRGGLRHSYLTGPEKRRLRVIGRDIQLPDSTNVYAFTVAVDSADVAQEIATFNNTLIIALSVLAFGLTGAVFLQVRFGLQPLRRLRIALSQIRSGREDRLETDYPIEIQPVARELNELLQANQDVVERARTHVGNLAHALKTPLSVMTNEVKVRPGKLADKIAEQTALMGDQINLYLDRARMAARVRVLGAAADIEAVVTRLVRTVKTIHGEKRLTIDVDLEKALVFRGEEQDLEEILGNVLDNACKWAERSVRVKCTRLHNAKHESMLEITIDDDGPGLAAGQHEAVLKRGRRLDETKPGSGLGLSIVSELVELYGGNLELKVSPLGGLQVRLGLPAN